MTAFFALIAHTARLSFSIFIVAFVASSLATLAPSTWTRWILRNRRYIGLAFALAHFIHLGAIISYFVAIDEAPPPIAVAFGGFGYVMVTVMALTSNDRAMRALGRNWKRLHAAGAYYIWFVFTQSYASRVFGGNADGAASPSPVAAYAVLLAIALAALALRGRHRFARR